MEHRSQKEDFLLDNFEIFIFTIFCYYESHCHFLTIFQKDTYGADTRL